MANTDDLNHLFLLIFIADQAAETEKFKKNKLVIRKLFHLIF